MWGGLAPMVEHDLLQAEEAEDLWNPNDIVPPAGSSFSLSPIHFTKLPVNIYTYAFRKYMSFSLIWKRNSLLKKMRFCKGVANRQQPTHTLQLLLLLLFSRYLNRAFNLRVVVYVH